MLKFLHVVGLMNAAVWLGGAVFFTFVMAPGLFQPAMKRLFHEYYVGTIAQMMQERYFAFHLVCGSIALLHALAQWFLRKRESQRVVLGLLAGILLLSLTGMFLLQPRMKSLFKIKYSAPTWSQRDQANASFGRWHGVAMTFNLIVLGGLVFYFWRLAGPSGASRYSTPSPTVNPFSGSGLR